MKDENNGNQPTNGNGGEPSGEGQYTESEKQLYARLQKEKDKVKELESQLQNKGGAPTGEPNGNGTGGSDDTWKERLELIARGYKDDSELDFIMRNGGKKALEDPLVQGALLRQKEQKEAEDKVTFGTSSKSDVERNYTPEQIKNMSAKEYEDVLMGRKK